MSLLLGFLLLLYASVTAKRLFPVILDSDDPTTIAVKKVYQTWDGKKGVIINENLWRKDIYPRNEQAHISGKEFTNFSNRTVSPYCNMPGYTGVNCEFPICEKTNTDIRPEPSISGTGTMTDAIMLASCSDSMTTVLDQEMYEIYIMVEANMQIRPRFVLYNINGKQINPVEVIENPDGWTYEATYMPQNPGTYIVQASAARQEGALCFVIVRAVTTLLTAAGFVPQTGSLPSDRNDFPQTGAIANQPTTFIVHGDNLRNPGSLVSVTVFENFNIMARPQHLLVRFNCGYEYFIEHFYCTDSEGSYYYRVDGIDFWGNKFRRIGQFNCFPGPITTSKPTNIPTPGPQRCLNNGELLKNADSTNYCFCQGLFSGEDCGKILCLNGGTRVNDATCLCLPGFSGMHCQDVKCISRTGFGFNTNHPTLILVIRMQSTMENIISKLKAQIQAIYNYYQNVDPDYLRRFAVIFFNDNKIINDFETTSISDVIGFLGNTTLQQTGKCEDSVFTAVEMALTKFLVTNRSPIYVFTDAMPNDEEEFETIFHLNTYWRAPVYVFFIEPPQSSGCTVDVYHTAYLRLEDMTKRTSGHVFYFPSNMSTKVAGAFFSHMIHVFHRSSLVSSYDAQSCQLQPQYQPISVDKRLNEIVVTAVGRGMTLTTISPSGNTTVQEFTYNINDVYFWSLQNPQLGQWMFSLTSDSPNSQCNYRIYSTQSRSGQRMEYDLFWGFTPGLIWDGPFLQPVADEPLGLVAHINNYIPNDAAKVFAELIVYKQSQIGRENIFATNGIWRDQCDYQLYFPAMTCTYDNEMLYFSIFVRDDLGTMIQRGGVAFCFKDHPTPAPPQDCQNGGVQLTTAENSTFCLCPSDWIGDKCQTPVCYNGATLQQSGGSWCSCPAGFIGTYCETVTCLTEGPEEPFTPINRDIAFVVDMTIYGVKPLDAFKSYVSNLIRDIGLHHPQWIENYVLVGYNSTSASILAIARRNEHERFERAVSDAFDTLIATKDQGCQSRLYYGIGEALNSIREDSYVIVLHASTPEVLNTEAYRVYNIITSKRILLNAFYAYSTGSIGSTPKCNASIAKFNFLNSLAEVNQGRAYPVENSNFHLVLPLIPTFYLSGVVYRKVSANCVNSAITVYFPIDSFTQTIQLNVIGYNNSITVYRPDGTEFADPYNFIDDMQQTGWRVSEIRRPCDYDQGWESLGPLYCALFSRQSNSWQNASTTCHLENGFLVDDLNPEKDSWIQDNTVNTDIWIGLYRNAGKFYWDTAPGLDPFQFNVSYNKWDLNEPSPDTSKQCVLRTSKGKWRMDKCSTQHYFICEKHRYDPNFEPTDLFDDHVPPGKWYVRVKGSKPPTEFTWPMNGCEVEIRIQSNIQVFPRFATDQHSDKGNEEPTSGSSYCEKYLDHNRFITHLYGDEDALLKYANIYNYDDMLMEAASTYQKRELCVYPWLSQNWSCYNYQNISNRFAVLHSGKDRTGQTFQRMTTGHCPTRSYCEHGMSIGGKCVCEDYWKGDVCDIPNCVNNGVLDEMHKTCHCSDGYTGNACQYVSCSAQVPATFSNNNKTFVLIVELTIPNKGAVDLLAANIEMLANVVISKHSTWFFNSVLITINGSHLVSSQVYNTLASFVQGVKQLPSQIIDPGTDCGAPLYLAVAQAARTESGSVVLTVTRSVVNDDISISPDYIAALLAKSKLQLYYLVVDDNEKVCGFAADTTKVEKLSAFALATNGNFFIIPTNRYIEFLLNYLPTLYTSTLVTTSSILDKTCKDAMWYAQVDYYMTALYVTTFTTHGAVGVLDPRHDFVPMETIFLSKRTRLVKIDTTSRPGIYTIRINAPSLCYAQIRGSSPITIWAGYIWSFPDKFDAVQADDPELYPIKGVNNTLVLHMGGELTQNGFLTYSEFINPYDRSVLVVSLYRRQNCSFEFYSDPFVCPDKDFFVMVNGVDDRGQNFRREVGLTHCWNITNYQNVNLQ